MEGYLGTPLVCRWEGAETHALLMSMFVPSTLSVSSVRDEKLSQSSKSSSTVFPACAFCVMFRVMIFFMSNVVSFSRLSRISFSCTYGCVFCRTDTTSDCMDFMRPT